MSRYLAYLIIVVLLVVYGCKRADSIFVHEIEGPAVLQESIGETFSVSVSGGSEYTFQWAVSPREAGRFEDNGSTEVVFAPAAVLTDLSAEISVVVNTVSSGPVLKSKKILIIDNDGRLNHYPYAAGFAETGRVNAGGEVGFHDVSFDPDPGDVIIKWEWDFAFDGSIGFNPESTERNPTHKFESPGVYYVQLRVTDTGGLTDVLDTPLPITVVSDAFPPVAVAGVDNQAQYTGQVFTFSGARSFDPDGGEITVFAWDWGNDGTFDSYGPSAEFSWDGAGIYEIQLQVTDDESQTAVLEEPVKIVVIDTSEHGWEVVVDDPVMSTFNSPTGLAVNDSDQVFLTGYFDMTDYDDPYAQTSLVSFIQKFNGDGELLLDSRYTTDEVFIEAVDVDSAGYHCLTGSFTGYETDLLPGAESFLGISNGKADILLLMYGPSDNFLWSATIGGPDDDYGDECVIDNWGNTYLVGRFTGYLDFDPGPGEYFLDSGDGYGHYMLKFNSSGLFQWAGCWENNAWIGEISIESDSFGDLVVSGGFNGSVDFDPGDGVYLENSDGQANIFLLKLDSSGTFEWVRTFGVEESGYPGRIATGNNDDIVFNFGLGESKLMKIDADGIDIWTKELGYGGWSGRLGVDVLENIYLFGYFGGIYGETVDFDPGPGVFELTAEPGDYILFLTKFNSNCEFQWVRTCEYWFLSFPDSLEVSSNGTAYVAGKYSNTFANHASIFIRKYLPNGQQ